MNALFNRDLRVYYDKLWTVTIHNITDSLWFVMFQQVQ